MKRFLFSISLMACALAACFAGKAYSPADIPNANKENRHQYVSDPDQLLSWFTIERVNESLDALRQKTTAEMAVIVVPSIGDFPDADFAEQVFTKWGLGKKDKDNGIMLLVAVDDHKVRLQTGYGVEGVLPDATCNRILNRDFIPNMKNGDLDKAVEATVGTVCKVLTDPTAMAEIKSEKYHAYDAAGNEEALDEETFMYFFIIVVCGMFLFGLITYIYTSVKSRKLPDNYTKTRYWDSQKQILGWAMYLSLGLAFPFVLMARRKIKKLRNAPLTCEKCGATMHKLNEELDNEYLDSAQDLEESLGTVDYDVWLCSSCGEVHKYPFKMNQSKFTECPHCHTIAMGEVEDRVLEKATTRHPGKGVKIYKCHYCQHTKEKTYTIPQKENWGAIAAGAAAGAMSSGRGGGGSIGGGFGGGFTGGGGASGRW